MSAATRPAPFHENDHLWPDYWDALDAILAAHPPARRDLMRRFRGQHLMSVLHYVRHHGPKPHPPIKPNRTRTHRRTK